MRKRIVVGSLVLTALLGALIAQSLQSPTIRFPGEARRAEIDLRVAVDIATREHEYQPTPDR